MSLIYSPLQKKNQGVVTSPGAYVRLVARGIELPPKAVICPFTPLVHSFVKQGNWKKYFLSAEVYCAQGKDFCLITGFGCGGPAVALVAEQVIALGVKQIVFVGLAGSLQEEVVPADTVVCQESICADGTSPHYTANEVVRTSKNLTAQLTKKLGVEKINFHFGRNWSTDAVFRETKKEIKHYQKARVLTVEMETSALLAVCKRRKIACAAVYVVSDFLGGRTWQPDFKNPLIWKHLRQIFLLSQHI